jgi:hypothetical protein
MMVCIEFAAFCSADGQTFAHAGLGWEIQIACRPFDLQGAADTPARNKLNFRPTNMNATI